MHTKNFQKEEISRFQLRININHLNLFSGKSPINLSPEGGGISLLLTYLFFYHHTLFFVIIFLVGSIAIMNLLPLSKLIFYTVN